MTLDCSYEYWKFVAVGSIYHCEIQTDPKIISPETAVIDGAQGPHHGPKTNDDVAGFSINNKNIKIYFFPQGLEKFYKNLKLIFIQHNRIKEVHQSDLKPLKKLQHLSLTDGYIQVIEEGLFDFNPELIYISLVKNRIIKIHPNVFDNLTKLTWLYLRENRCISINATSSSEIEKMISDIKMNCTMEQDSNLIIEFEDDSAEIDDLDAKNDAGTRKIPKSFIMILTIIKIVHYLAVEMKLYPIN